MIDSESPTFRKPNTPKQEFEKSARSLNIKDDCTVTATPPLVISRVLNRLNGGNVILKSFASTTCVTVNG